MKYKFSIIMPIYKVEEYIKEAIDSVIGQSLDFKKNVQLILINDGSPDNCERICLEYKKKYPNNIVYKLKENGGLSSTRNYGLKYIEGEYVNFLDPDDFLDKNSLKAVLEFFDKYNDEVDLVAIPIQDFGEQEHLNMMYKFFGTETRIVDLIEEPYNFVFSSAATFSKAKIFENRKFDEEMVGAEDAKFNFPTLLEKKKIGYVTGNHVNYYYRRIDNGNSIINSFKKNLTGFTVIFDFMDSILEKVPDKNNLPDFVKEIFVFSVLTRHNLLSESQAISDDNYQIIINKFKYYLSFVDDEYIAENKHYANGRLQKYILFYYKYGKSSFAFDGKTSVKVNDANIFEIEKLAVRIRKMDFEGDDLIIDVSFTDLDIINFKNHDIALLDKNNETIYPFYSDDLESGFDIYSGYKYISLTKYRRFKVDMTKLNSYHIIFYDKDNKDNYIISRDVITEPYRKFKIRRKMIRLFNNNNSVSLFKNKIVVRSTVSNFKYVLYTFNKMRKLYHKRAYYRLFNKREKRYILINDRPLKADDNGEALFTYINKNRPDLAKDTYFVMSKEAPDYQRLAKIGNVVDLASHKHKKLFINSKYIFSSHNARVFYRPFDLKELKFYDDLLDYKFIWLQHGITQNDISKYSNKFRIEGDYIVVATKHELEDFSQDKYFFNSEDIVTSGFPRFDYLESDPQKTILFSPTWRSYLSGPILSDGFHEEKPGFEKSVYYRNVKAVLTDEKLYTMLKEKEYKFKFLLHPGFEVYLGAFKKFQNEVIEIVSVRDVNYKKELSEAALLITDYSSIFFDFAYMKKPLIYYQFDQADFYGKHYTPGSFDCERDGFGDVCKESNEVINKLEFYFNNDFKVEEKYLERVQADFLHQDKNNSKRLIDQVMKKDK